MAPSAGRCDARPRARLLSRPRTTVSLDASSACHACARQARQHGGWRRRESWPPQMAAARS
eukprot:8549544-Alexandrium_andersonii.AAC.1